MPGSATAAEPPHLEQQATTDTPANPGEER
jgi:hypothetical protein